MKILPVIATATLLGLLQAKENPAFKYWTDWKVGSWATYKTTAGGGIEIETTITLAEAAIDKVVIQSSGKMTVAGKEKATAPRRQEIKPQDPKMGTIEKEGDEAVEVAGKTYACHWIQTSQDSAVGKVLMKMWFSKEIPGGIVRSVVGDPAEPETLIQMILTGSGAK